MKDWKTTVPGVLAGIAQIVKVLMPEGAAIADLFTALCLAAMGVYAKQTGP